jgi:hypothetical protein
MRGRQDSTTHTVSFLVARQYASGLNTISREIASLQKKYQIFVSSTFRDLIEERQDTIKSILDLGHIPAGMEGFPAIDMEQLKYIKKIIDQCDYYILIVAARYGSVDADGISYTEKEYQYAVETGKAVLAFVLENPESLPLDKTDSNSDTLVRLGAFRAHVMTGRIVHLWKDRDSLKYAVFKSLVATFDELPGIGWVRANRVASEDLLEQINELRIRNEQLQTAYDHLKDELTPKIGDVAPLDSSFSVHYSYSQRISHEMKTYKNSVTMTWRTIFTAIGPELIKARPPRTISTSLDKFLTEKNLVGEKYPHILDATENQIKIQLSALRLIKNFQALNTSGAMAEWVQLTELGTQTLYETMTIRETGAE